MQSPIKRQILRLDLEKDPNICCLQEMPFKKKKIKTQIVQCKALQTVSKKKHI